MAKSLKTLTRIQKFKIDEQRKILVDYQNKEDEIINMLARLALEMENERKFSSSQPNPTNFGNYIKLSLQKREILENELAAIRKKIEEVQEIIADMFKEQKTYEIIDENRTKAETQEQNYQEQKMLDEIGTNTYIKKHSD